MAQLELILFSHILGKAQESFVFWTKVCNINISITLFNPFSISDVYSALGFQTCPKWFHEMPIYLKYPTPEIDEGVFKELINLFWSLYKLKGHAKIVLYGVPIFLGFFEYLPCDMRYLVFFHASYFSYLVNIQMMMLGYKVTQ